MPPPPEGLLACSVRDCGAPLSRSGRTYRCPAGHAFDVARSGYVNLLQPQDRRSRAAGDSREAVAARARLLDAGVGTALFDAVLERLASVSGALLELGSGTGHLLGRAAETLTRPTLGIDLSVAAIELATRRFPGLGWVVANADRRLPVLSGSVAAVLSIHGRHNPPECARVLAPGGLAVVAFPAGDDVAELRAIAQGEARVRDRTPERVAELAPYFQVIERCTVRTVHRLERAALMDLLHGTYRGLSARIEERCADLASLEVTLASELLVLQSPV